VVALAQANSSIRASAAARAEEGGLSDAAKQLRRYGAALNRLASVADHMPEEQLQALLASAQRTCEIGQQAQPAFASTAGSQAGWSRQDSDRTCQPLFPKRGGKRKAGDEVEQPASLLGSVEEQPDAAAHGGSDAFATIITSRPSTRVRGVGEMTRNAKPTYPKRQSTQR
jgi:hypothetical protein